MGAYLGLLAALSIVVFWIVAYYLYSSFIAARRDEISANANRKPMLLCLRPTRLRELLGTGERLDLAGFAEINRLPEKSALRHLESLYEEFHIVVVGVGDDFPDDSEGVWYGVEVVLVPREQWKSEVSDRAQRAKVILFVPGLDNGINWELDEIILHNLKKTLVLMPPFDEGTTYETNMPKTDYGWALVQEHLAERGYKLPDYRQRGLLYFPAEDLSIATSVELNGRMRNLASAVREIWTETISENSPLDREDDLYST